MKPPSDLSPAQREGIARIGLRKVAQGIICARRAYRMWIHAKRDHCTTHAMLAQHYAITARHVLPSWVWRDKDFLHQYVEMPACRELLRHDLEEATHG